jgi:hypothetical protein
MKMAGAKWMERVMQEIRALTEDELVAVAGGEYPGGHGTGPMDGSGGGPWLIRALVYTVASAIYAAASLIP